MPRDACRRGLSACQVAADAVRAFPRSVGNHTVVGRAYAVGLRPSRGFVAVLVVIALSVGAPGLMPAAGAHENHSEYADVLASGTHSAAIADLAGTRVLDGTECEPDKFCPEEPMLRWVMAVWLVRAVDGGDPVGGEEPRFADVGAGEWWAAHTERLAQLGVTEGCSADPMLFCPEDAVTRAQMASFLVRAFDLQQAAPTGFGDTAGTVHAANIDALAGAGVTVGCSSSPLRYCPHDPVTRAQMATFLVRALGSASPVADPPASASYRITYEILEGPHWNAPLSLFTWREFAIIADLEGPGHEVADLNDEPPILTDVVYGWLDREHILFRDNQLGIYDVEARTAVGFGGTCSGVYGWSPDGKYFASANTLDLYGPNQRSVDRIVDVDGRVLATLARGSFAAWSPDGRMAYTTEEGLWVANPDLTGARKISDGYDLAWSPDGKKIAYTSGSNEGKRHSSLRTDIWVADDDGTNERRVAEGYIGYLHGWSPDGRYIAYTGVGLWVVSVDGSNPLRVGGRDYEDFMGWSPDGRYLAYSTDTFFTRRISRLWLADGDGSNPVMIAESDSSTSQSPPMGWSPDGKHIAYTVATRPSADSDLSRPDLSRPEGWEVLSHEVWVAHTDGSSPVRIGDGWFDSWSPDGRLVAYTVGIDPVGGWYVVDDTMMLEDSGEVWVVEADGSNPVLLTEYGDSVKWAPL